MENKISHTQAAKNKQQVEFESSCNYCNIPSHKEAYCQNKKADLAKKETVATSVAAFKFVLRNITIIDILLRNEDMTQIGQTHGREIELKNKVREKQVESKQNECCHRHCL